MSEHSKSGTKVNLLSEIKSFAELNGITIPDAIKSNDEAKTLKLYLSYILQEFESKTRAEASERHGFKNKNIDYIHLTFQNLDDVHQISSVLANLYPDPERVMLGITEMMLNAVEHGNLGITYQEKGELVSNGKWIHEI